MKYKGQEILFETKSGKVKLAGCKSKMKITYRNMELEQSMHEFSYFQSTINSLYRYIKDVRQVYYRKFLIQLSKYKLSIILNAAEIIELYELLGGAKTMMDFEKIIDSALKEHEKKTGSSGKNDLQDG